MITQRSSANGELRRAGTGGRSTPVQSPRKPAPRTEVKLTVVIPCYNERGTIAAIVDAVGASSWPEQEIIVIDDCSTDGTREVLEAISGKIDRLIRHDANRGKGAAIRSGVAAATGEVVIIQDADL